MTAFTTIRKVETDSAIVEFYAVDGEHDRALSMESGHDA